MFVSINENGLLPFINHLSNAYLKLINLRRYYIFRDIRKFNCLMQDFR